MTNNGTCKGSASPAPTSSVSFPLKEWQALDKSTQISGLVKRDYCWAPAKCWMNAGGLLAAGWGVGKADLDVDVES
jgi:hypothetical protein